MRLENEQQYIDHFKVKTYNQPWLYQCFTEDSPEEYFPYQLPPNKVGFISNHEVTALRLHNNLPLHNNEDPAFVLNIPFVPSGEDYAKLNLVLKNIKEESYGPRSEEKPAVTIGFNKVYSIDPKANQQFRDYIANLPEVEGIAFRALAFLWQLPWEAKPSFQDQKLHPKEKAYFLLKVLKPQKGARILKELETSQISSRIPYQAIRETIKNSKATAELIRRFYEQEHRLVYLATMDPDFISICDEQGQGILSHARDVVNQANENFPHLLTLGYSAAADQWPSIRLGVLLDMKVRTAISEIFPQAPYYPEPFFAWYVDPEGRNLSASFIQNNGRSARLESRRLIDSGIQQRLFDPQRMAFEYRQALVTDTARIVTLKSQKFSKIDASNIGQRQILEALRGVGQSHFFPKQFADSIYHALPITCRVEYITQPITKILGAFDPITLSYNLKETRYSKNDLTTVINSYRPRADLLLQAVDDYGHKDDYARRYAETIYPHNPPKQAEVIRKFIANLDIIMIQYQTLQDQGLTPQQCQNITQACYKAGKAAAEVFSQILSNELIFIKAE
ncbi:MAG: hypothetical protein ACQEP8_01490 [Chlamydiota bacterium]